ncbi:LOW QUALITY PROTEIN: zinc finger protein RFP-like [Emydura macquarii macquarii]|uniref:LOW QUALITY PROTEIN: zinc finger protein RFP-like n=1 Tax=Emydura macquarii macquarii TaxID=1129001 RepID=UPI00352A45F6
MAAGSPLESLQDEATCPICLDYFREPVTMECGHNYCQACITQYWERSGTDISCPQCRETVRQRNFRPNRQLANVLEIAKQLSLQVIKEAGRERVCGEHQEPLKLFCEEDQSPICVICDRSEAHRAHTLVPIEEAGQEYKKKLQAHLKTLREERDKLLGFKVAGEWKSQEYLKQTQTERQKIMFEFQQLRQFLEEQERLLLVQVEKLYKEIVKIENENITKLSAEISHLSELISEMKGMCQKPVSEFLQDIRSTLSRCEKEKCQPPGEISPQLEKILCDFAHKNIVLTKTLRKFKDVLHSEVEKRSEETLGPYRQVNVTLDPDTAHPQLVLSADQRSARWGDTWQDLPDKPERFVADHCVLGCEGFTWGRHYWEVELGVGDAAMGLAREPMRQKGRMSHNPAGGIWAVMCWWGKYRALTSPEIPLPLVWVPRRIQVCLDYEWGQVTFFDANNGVLIFTFPPASFWGERIRPWFWVGKGSRVSLCH